jgi:hypothetical protein
MVINKLHLSISFVYRTSIFFSTKTDNNKTLSNIILYYEIFENLDFRTKMTKNNLKLAG